VDKGIALADIVRELHPWLFLIKSLPPQVRLRCRRPPRPLPRSGGRGGGGGGAAAGQQLAAAPGPTRGAAARAQVRIALVEKLADIEHRLAYGTSERLQLGAMVAAFTLVRDAIAAAAK
jgi:hypothetical protein